MNQKVYMWEKEGFLGCPILYSNSDKSYYSVIFAGAEKLDNTPQYKVHFIYHFQSMPHPANGLNVASSSSNMTIIVAPHEAIRFSNHLGVTEEVTITYCPEEFGSIRRFFPVKEIKFLEIKTDFIRYEVHPM